MARFLAVCLAIHVVCSGPRAVADDGTTLNPRSWLPVSGQWSAGASHIRELSDSADAGDRPFWAAGGSTTWSNYRLEAALEALDGVGSFYLAIRWQNRENHYALELGEPGGRVRILLTEQGQTTELAAIDDTITIGARQPPVPVAFEATGVTLRAYVNGEPVLDVMDDTFAGGCVAIGERHRRAAFSSLRMVETTPGPASTGFRIRYTGVRRVFLRHERDATAQLTITNATAETGEGLRAHVELDGLMPQDIPLPNLEPGDETTVQYTLNGEQLRDSEYALRCTLSAADRVLTRKTFAVWIAPPVNRAGLDVLCWDSTGVSEEALQEMQRLGFTCRTLLLFSAARATDLTDRPWLMPSADAGLRFGLDAMIRASTPGVCDDDDTFIKGMNGEPQLGKHRMNCPNHPLVRRRVTETAGELANTIRDMPAFRYLLLNSETENEERKLAPCRHTFCVESGQRELGCAIPAGLERGWSVVGASMWKNPQAFGVSEAGLIDDDNPHYRYLKWWWQSGSGFTALNRLFGDTLKAEIPHLKSFHDPVLRCPAFLGRCAGLDLVSTWTYTNPSPLGVLQNADELLAMANGQHGVCQTIQLFWYKSAAIPPNDATGKVPASADSVSAEDADAWGNYITISPAHLREAVWLALSRPVSMLQFGGASAICDRPGSYDYTNRDTPREMERLATELIKPYGPMLRAMSERSSNVAILSSAAGSLFGRTGSYGQTSGAFGDCHKTVSLAQLQPHVVFDETIRDADLATCRALVLPACKVLPNSVHSAILRFAEAGGIVVADNALGPKIPGALRFAFPDTKQKGLGALEQHTMWVSAGRRLAGVMREKGLRQSVSSTSPDVILSLRNGHGARCIMVVNDRRQAGSYVGGYGRILDDGAAQEADLLFDAEEFSEGVFYNTSLRRQLTTIREGTHLKGRVLLPPAGGRLIYWSVRPLASVVMDAPPAVKRGETVTLRFSVQDPDGALLPGVQPLRVAIRDSSARSSAYSGYYAAVNGTFSLGVSIAINDQPGHWLVSVEDLIAGNRANAAFAVNP